MARMFDSTEERTKSETARRSREEVKQRAAEVDRILEEEGLMDKTAGKIGEILANSPVQQVQSVEPIHYASFRRPGSKWMIEHARVGDDYIYQLFPLKPPAIPWQDVIIVLIAVMDVIYPRSVVIKYVPPNDAYQVKYYTVRVTNVVGLPGWEIACKERSLNGLAAADVWSRA